VTAPLFEWLEEHFDNIKPLLPTVHFLDRTGRPADRVTDRRCSFSRQLLPNVMFRWISEVAGKSPLGFLPFWGKWKVLSQDGNTPRVHILTFGCIPPRPVAAARCLRGRDNSLGHPWNTKLKLGPQFIAFHSKNPESLFPDATGGFFRLEVATVVQIFGIPQIARNGKLFMWGFNSLRLQFENHLFPRIHQVSPFEWSKRTQWAEGLDHYLSFVCSGDSIRYCVLFMQPMRYHD
jgi:hypothetical protein